MDDGDLAVRQGHARVGGDDGRVVPGLDLAQEDVGEQGATEAQLAGFQAVDVDHRHHAADGRRELGQAGLGQLVAAQRLVGGAEINGAGLDLGDATTGTDRLVVDLGAGGGVVVGRPLGHQREDEGGASTGDLSGHLVAGSGRSSGTVSGRLLCGLLVATAGRQAQGDGQGKGGKAGRVQFHGHSIAG
ncbi:hypothetical protein D3C81_1353580 [compost metagenome]